MISCGGSKLFGPFFWKVQKEGKTSYFLGTFHVANTLEHLQCSDKIKSHLENSNLLLTEFDPEESQQFAQQKYAEEQQKKISKDGHEFQSLSKKSQMFLRSRAKPENLTYSAYVKDVRLLCIKQAIFKSGAGAISLDAQLRAISLENNIPVKFLDEGVDFNKLDKYTKSNAKIDAESINTTISHFEACVSGILAFIHSYRKGTITSEELNKVITDEQKKISLKDRNEKWVVQFKEAYKSNQYKQIFLAGGTAHFIAEFNVLDMLKQEGFSISRMNARCLF